MAVVTTTCTQCGEAWRAVRGNRVLCPMCGTEVVAVATPPPVDTPLSQPTKDMDEPVELWFDPLWAFGFVLLSIFVVVVVTCYVLM